MFGIIVIIVVVLGALLIFAEMRPSEFEIQRNMIIDAPPEKVFVLIDDFRNWPRWQPLDLTDPSLHRDYDSAARGKGAVSMWQGKDSTGRQEIIESKPAAMIMIKVDFTKPFKAHNVNTFTLAPSRSGTSLTWTVRGTLPLFAKIMSIVINMDRSMGKHLEDGLRNLKAEAETLKLQQPVSG
jgi:uncharacterized protein YndB with AHSA1/START domain